ncbi:MAG: lysophospholipid acyltransferase family protein [Planctomycetota bacterium]
MEREKSFFEKIFFFIIRNLGALFLKSLCSTLTLHRSGIKHEREIFRKGERPIYAFWHGRLLILAYSHRDRKVQIMISEHKDGEIIAQVINQLGFGSIRGSTTRGGMRAVRELARKAHKGFATGITPDGPKGPRHVAQAGSIYAAMKTGFPLLPITSSAFPRWTLSSWDKFIVPKPFATTIVKIGRPFYVPANLSEKEREQYRLQFEKEMIKLVEAADRKVEILHQNR